jgi:integrase
MGDVMPLTALEIKNAKEGMHADGNGLYLKVTASGTKSWIFRFQLEGRRREMGLGTLNHKPTIEARKEAAQLLAMVRSGVDPIEQRRQQLAEAAEAALAAKARGVTFADAAKAYIDAHKAGWRNAKHGQQWANTLATYAEPVIGSKPVQEVSTEDVLRILKPLWTTKTETASRVRSRIELVLAYAKAMKWRDAENPALWRGHLDALLPPPTKVKQPTHHAALPYARAAGFMAELRQVRGIGARALEFAILTATRSGEVRLAAWDEFDLEKRVWTIPAKRMKAGQEHRVPLSGQSVALLQMLPRISDSPYLFPGERARQPLSDMTLSMVVRRMNEPEQHWLDPKTGEGVVPHGFRSTFRDWAAEVGGYPREMAEHALAHTLESKVEAAYHRGSMVERRIPMMQAWADYLDGVVAGVAEIIPFRAA